MTDEEKIRRFLQRQSAKAGRRSPAAIGSRTRLFGGALDSFGVLELAAFLEENLRVTLKRQDVNAKNFDTIERILKLVARRRKARKAA